MPCASRNLSRIHIFKISPDETLKVVQELYEKKLVTYPRFIRADFEEAGTVVLQLRKVVEQRRIFILFFPLHFQNARDQRILCV